MSGYRDRSELESPAPRLTGFDRIAGAILCLAGGVLALLFAAIIVGLVPASLAGLHDKVSPVAPVMWLFAGTFLMRAGAASPAERVSPRTLRIMALVFFLFGVVLMALPAFFS